MARPQVADGGDGLDMWRAAAIILNRQSRTADNGWYYSLVVGLGAKTFLPSYAACFIDVMQVECTCVDKKIGELNLTETRFRNGLSGEIL